MKKISIYSAGSYDKLKFEEYPDFEIEKDDEVIIDVQAFGINFADVCVRFGVYSSAKEYVGWPITPGFEVSGIIKSVGSEVKKFEVGQKVIAFTLFNGYASQVRVKEDQILSLPSNFSFEEGAGFPAVFFTAYHALYQHIVLHPESTLLIHSAAGGVGTALVQLCNNAGHKTVGVIGSSHKREYLKQFNPDAIIDKSSEDLWEKAREFSPEGYDAIFDANGFTTLKDSYKHLKPTGKLLVYGSHDLFSKGKGRINYIKAGIGLLKLPRFKPNDLITDNKSIIGFNISYLFHHKKLIKQVTSNLINLLNKDELKPVPVTTFKYERLEDAHKLIESGKSVGKIVVTF